jgi:hypothetical protein
MHIYKQTLLLSFTVNLLLGCNAAHNTVGTPPSQNSTLQSISPSKTAGDDHEEYRYMQKNTNEWIENEWEPLTEGNATVTKNGEDNNTDTKSVTVSNEEEVTGDDNSSTGLQYYVDKAGVYLENKKKRDANVTKQPSHVDKVNAMPGIGKIDRR